MPKLDDGPIDGQLDLMSSVAPEDAYDGAQRADDNAEIGWREAALIEIKTLARSGYEFTADDVRAKVGEPDVANRWGGVFLAASRAGLIETVAVRSSATKTRHAGMVRVWRGTGGRP